MRSGPFVSGLRGLMAVDFFDGDGVRALFGEAVIFSGEEGFDLFSEGGV